MMEFKKARGKMLKEAKQLKFILGEDSEYFNTLNGIVFTLSVLYEKDEQKLLEWFLDRC